MATRHLTELEKIECAEYVIDLLDKTKAKSGNQSNEHTRWMARARDLLKKRASQYLKIRGETGTFR